MEQHTKQKLLECIDRVYELAEDAKLEADFFEKADAELTLLSEYFRVSKSQALFISIIFTLNLKRTKLKIFTGSLKFTKSFKVKL